MRYSAILLGAGFLVILSGCESTRWGWLKNDANKPRLPSEGVPSVAQLVDYLNDLGPATLNDGARLAWDCFENQGMVLPSAPSKNIGLRALATGAQPGTPEFRTALRDAIVTTKELVGTHAIYNFKPGVTSGVDERAQVLVKLIGGKWTLMQ